MKLKILHDKLSLDRICNEFYDLIDDILEVKGKGHHLNPSECLKIKQCDIIKVTASGENYKIYNNKGNYIGLVSKEIVKSFTEPVLTDKDKIEKLKKFFELTHENSKLCPLKSYGVVKYGVGCDNASSCTDHYEKIILKILE
jgi:hypothetical protein